MNGRAATARLLTAGLAITLLAAIAACGAPTGTQGADDTGAPVPTIRLAITSVQATSGPTGPPPAPLTSSAAADPDAAIEELAAAWLVAYRTASFTGTADGWIDRTTPYITEDLHQQNDQLRRDGRGPGVAWQDFVDRRCTARVDDVAAVIPPEAPRTENTVHVQAAGTLRTTCAAGANPPDEALSVTLTAVRNDDGWRIASRDY